jgi:hypothetical protein
MRKQMDVEMEQREARQKYTEGAFVLAMGVPPGAEFGVDMMVYTVHTCPQHAQANCSRYVHDCDRRQISSKV